MRRDSWSMNHIPNASVPSMRSWPTRTYELNPANTPFLITLKTLYIGDLLHQMKLWLVNPIWVSLNVSGEEWHEQEQHTKILTGGFCRIITRRLTGPPTSSRFWPRISGRSPPFTIPVNLATPERFWFQKMKMHTKRTRHDDILPA